MLGVLERERGTVPRDPLRRPRTVLLPATYFLENLGPSDGALVPHQEARGLPGPDRI